MNNDIPAVRIRIIKNSLRCFGCGLLGLLPVIGFPFAIAALVLAGKVRVSQQQSWNPAETYRVWGVMLATAGILLWALILMLMAFGPAQN